MTEKRFTTNDWLMYDKDKHINSRQAIALLNKQYEEIVNLTSANLKMREYNEELEKENQQLKSENNMLRTTIGRNEAHIYRLEHQSEWTNTANIDYEPVEEAIYEWKYGDD